ncbi:MAG TPA: hypothetical protein VF798_15505 [Burkholderiaceae bacterium]
MKENGIAFVVQRAGKDRRSGELLEPPYMTDEGMVLFDRRSHEDRRNGIMPPLMGGIDPHAYGHGTQKR